MASMIDARVEIARELQVREHVYPKLVQQGKLTAGEADRRMRSLRMALSIIDEAADRIVKHYPHTTE